MHTLDATTTQALLIRLNRLRPDFGALWGKMNAHQMMCHLNDSYRAVMGGRIDNPAATFMNRTLVRWVALHTPLIWPKGVPTRPEVDQVNGGGTRPVEFESDRAQLAATIQQFAAQPRTFVLGRHPILGELNEWEWMRWGYLHADHHFRQFGI